MTIFRHLAMALLMAGTVAHAQAIENVDALDRQVATALGAPIGSPGGAARPIDRRLKLAACPSAVAVDPPAFGAVILRCEPIGWKIRVALVPTASPAHRSATVRSTGYAPAEPEPAAAEIVVRKGDQVELVAAASSFSVSTTAIADQDGAVGDRIRVRSAPRSPAMIGVVGETGQIFLPQFK